MDPMIFSAIVGVASIAGSILAVRARKTLSGVAPAVVDPTNQRPVVDFFRNMADQGLVAYFQPAAQNASPSPVQTAPPTPSVKPVPSSPASPPSVQLDPTQLVQMFSMLLQHLQATQQQSTPPATTPPPAAAPAAATAPATIDTATLRQLVQEELARLNTLPAPAAK